MPGVDHDILLEWYDWILKNEPVHVDLIGTVVFSVNQDRQNNMSHNFIFACDIVNLLD